LDVGQVYPVAYILMESLHTLAYEAAFQRLRELGMEPTEVVCDFEEAIRNAVRMTWGEPVRISGCIVHYATCIYRAVKRLGMVRLVRDNRAVLKIVRLLTGKIL
jgi:hypothetical protein